MLNDNDHILVSENEIYKLNGYKLGTHKINSVDKNFCIDCNNINESKSMEKEHSFHKSRQNSSVVENSEYINNFVCDQCGREFKGVVVGRI